MMVRSNDWNRQLYNYILSCDAWSKQLPWLEIPSNISGFNVIPAIDFDVKEPKNEDADIEEEDKSMAIQGEAVDAAALPLTVEAKD